MPRHPAILLFRDELVGFARSRVMLVLWGVLPLLATLGYFLLPSGAGMEGIGGEQQQVPLTYMMGLLVSSLAGTVAAVLIAVDIVSERNRNVYELFVIRPIPRDAIIWSKAVAVFGCVAVACVISVMLGVVVDLVRGVPLPPGMLQGTFKSLGSVVGVIGLSVAAGAVIGVISRSVLVAVILVLYVGQNLAIVPMLPTYLGVAVDLYWLVMGLSALLTLMVLWLAGFLFRRAQF